MTKRMMTNHMTTAHEMAPLAGLDDLWLCGWTYKHAAPDGARLAHEPTHFQQERNSTKSTPEYLCDGENACPKTASMAI